jgi:hypothetical protein
MTGCKPVQCMLLLLILLWNSHAGAQQVPAGVQYFQAANDLPEQRQALLELLQAVGMPSSDLAYANSSLTGQRSTLFLASNPKSYCAVPTAAASSCKQTAHMLVSWCSRHLRDVDDHPGHVVDALTCALQGLATQACRLGLRPTPATAGGGASHAVVKHSQRS